MRRPGAHALALALGLAGACTRPVSAPGQATPAVPAVQRSSLSSDLLTWPRARADAFGCFLERAFGHRDARFNCALQGYQNEGDPCHADGVWTEGPALPAALAARVHPRARAVELAWEHGELQAVTVELSGKLSPAEARQALGLPPTLAKLPSNVMSLDVQDCGSGVTCVQLQGFDHMGAGDTDCGD